jgi:signal transduction histidine kinase
MLKTVWLVLLAWGGSVLPAGSEPKDASPPGIPWVTNLAQFGAALAEQQGAICRFQLAGTVLAADNDSGLVIFQDASGAELLELSPTGSPLRAGDYGTLSGTNYVRRTENGLSLGQRPVIDNDGEHFEIERIGTLFLTAGRHSIQAHWFNRNWRGMLGLTYSSPSMKRRPIPDEALTPPARPDLPAAKGLFYQCFEGDWLKLPDFTALKPVKQGVASNFNLKELSRPEKAGMTFSGNLEVAQAGVYTFYLRSDDGSCLYLDNSPLEWRREGDRPVPAPARLPLRQPTTEEHGAFWAEVEGHVTFLGQNRSGTDLELACDGDKVRVSVLKPAGPAPAAWLGRRVRVRGVCLNTRSISDRRIPNTVLAPAWDLLEIPDSSAGASSPGAAGSTTPPLLTTAAQVQRLKHEEASKGYRARLRGVVTWVAKNQDCLVLQDETRGVFIGLQPAWIWTPPWVGELLEIQGRSDAAEFSPILILEKVSRLGLSPLPEPARPTWDQLIGGSMDSQYVELQGLVTGARTNHLTLLTAGGKLDLAFAPVPVGGLNAFIGSVVRIRGCIFAQWNSLTRQVTTEHPLWFGSATFCVDEPPPSDPFNAVSMKARELTQYDAERNFLRRVKTTGQVLSGRMRHYYLNDNGSGVRLELAQSAAFEPGDRIEVAGLLRLGEASPVVHEAVARKTGQAPLPAPQPLLLDRTNANFDASRVWIEGILLDARDSSSDKVLEMQSGLKTFVARLPGRPPISWPVGSRLKLTGTYSDLGGNRSGRNEVRSFELLLNSVADIGLVARPPWWTLGRLLATVTLLGTGLALAFVWITLLRRQVERRTAQLEREIRERERAEQGRAIEQERARIARDLHDDLGSSLTGISMLATSGRVARLSAEASNERLELVAAKARTMVTALDELVWAVNPRNDTLAALAEYLASYAEELLSRTGIRCRIELPLEYPARTIAAEARHNILLAVREALNNAVRHGSPTEVQLELTVVEARLEIRIRDNGSGFDAAQIRHGNGLTNLQERLRKINGSCLIDSVPGSGTMVTLTLPFHPPAAG